MGLVELSTNGQITIPPEILQKMNLKAGDKVLFVEENGKIYIQNSSSANLSTFQKTMNGAAVEAGFKTPDDVVVYIKELRNTNFG